jgi:hypothetical protein
MTELRELTNTELDAVSGGAMRKTTGSSGFQLNVGNGNGNSLLSVQTQNGNGILNSNINTQSNNNNISLHLGGGSMVYTGS